uniref:Uncharacterized protein n=1 Tax=Strongyloides papillosus TaxID=174720 RepID=A0A0N5C235_STREA
MLSIKHLEFIICICMLFVLVISEEYLNVGNWNLECYRYSGNRSHYEYHATKAERYVNKTFKIHGSDVKKNTFVFRLSMTKKVLTSSENDGEMRLRLFNTHYNLYYTSSLLPREPIMENRKDTTEKDYLVCNLYRCQIGFFYYCNNKEYHCLHHTKGQYFIYITLTKSYEYDNFVLKLIPKSSENKNILSVVVCPGSTWLREFSNSQYIETADNYLMKSTFGTNSNNYTLKYMYCHDIG